MKALFEVKDIVNDWAPPFQKKVTLSEYAVNESEGFSSFEKSSDAVFRLLSVRNGNALVEYNKSFTLKGHEHPQNHQIWVSRNQPVSFTFLWGEKGVTKTLVLKEVMIGDGHGNVTESAQTPEVVVEAADAPAPN